MSLIKYLLCTWCLCVLPLLVLMTDRKCIDFHCHMPGDKIQIQKKTKLLTCPRVQRCHRHRSELTPKLVFFVFMDQIFPDLQRWNQGGQIQESTLYSFVSRTPFEGQATLLLRTAQRYWEKEAHLKRTCYRWVEQREKQTELKNGSEFHSFFTCYNLRIVPL